MVTLPNNLETFADKGRYSSPEFDWNVSLGVTALEFLKNDTLGSQYQNDLFAADYNNDYLYNFNLIEDRTRLDLNRALDDKVTNNNKELDDLVFVQGFGIATDIREGPDGYLYVLSHIHLSRYRIVPNEGLAYPKISSLRDRSINWYEYRNLSICLKNFYFFKCMPKT